MAASSLAPATFSTCITNYLGYEVCYVTVAFPPIPVNLCPGNACWFNLENATTNAGDPVYWSVEMLPTGGSVAFSKHPTIFPPAEAFALIFSRLLRNPVLPMKPCIRHQCQGQRAHWRASNIAQERLAV